VSRSTPERPKTSATKPGAIRKLAGILTRVIGQPFTHKSRPLEEFLDKILAAIRQGTRRGVPALISTASRRCLRAPEILIQNFPLLFFHSCFGGISSMTSQCSTIMLFSSL
jgi:hypothetical protein